MFKLPPKIMSDIDNFMKQTLDGETQKALAKAQEKALIHAWHNVMHDDLRANNISKNNKTISARTEQAYAFEIGFVGNVKVTPLLQEWGISKGVSIPKTGTFPVNFQKHRSRYKFMFKSIPNKGETKAVTDLAFSQTIRGGTV